jgi:hypothetical protein
MSSTFGIYGVLTEWVKVFSLALKVARRLSGCRSTLLDQKNSWYRLLYEVYPQLAVI